VESQFQQLRFDISEKVRLYPQQPGIGALLELDLYPDVEIKDEGQHLKIQGYLRLNGSYYAQNPFVEEEVHAQMDDVEREGERQELAYVIPVEITLPADRAGLGHIATEVEAFDYQVISPFELQIEAVLMIDGILPEQAKASASMAEHVPQSLDLEIPPQTLSILGEEEAGDSSEKEIAARIPEMVDPSVPPSVALPVTGEDGPKVEKDEAPDRPPPHLQKQKKSLTQPVFQPEMTEKFWEQRQESKEEVKLKREEVAPLPSESEGGEKTAPLPPEAQPEGDDATAPLLGDQEVVDEYLEEPTGIEWIDWLVRSREESFVPIRMVIVQKEDSVNQIADRYAISVEQLMRMNPLQIDALEEGQILYIPPHQAEVKRV
jgi:stage VI sporulation protein D